MSTFVKEVKNNDNTIDMIEFSSNDNYKVNIGRNYVLANRTYEMTNAFKKSIFGSDIGHRSQGFAGITALSAVIAVSVFVGLILSFRI